MSNVHLVWESHLVCVSWNHDIEGLQMFEVTQFGNLTPGSQYFILFLLLRQWNVHIKFPLYRWHLKNWTLCIISCCNPRKFAPNQTKESKRNLQGLMLSYVIFNSSDHCWDVWFSTLGFHWGSKNVFISLADTPVQGKLRSKVWMSEGEIWFHTMFSQFAQWASILYIFIRSPDTGLSIHEKNMWCGGDFFLAKKIGGKFGLKMA